MLQEETKKKTEATRMDGLASCILVVHGKCDIGVFSLHVDIRKWTFGVAVIRIAHLCNSAPRLSLNNRSFRVATRATRVLEKGRYIRQSVTLRMTGGFGGAQSIRYCLDIRYTIRTGRVGDLNRTLIHYSMSLAQFQVETFNRTRTAHHKDAV